MRPRQNGRHFADDIFKCIFFSENVWIPIRISLKFVAKGQINNIPALVQIMAWRRPDDKSFSEPMMVRLLTHICVTWLHWVNHLRPGDVYKHSYLCFRYSFTTEPMMICAWTTRNNFGDNRIKIHIFSFNKIFWKFRLQNAVISLKLRYDMEKNMKLWMATDITCCLLTHCPRQSLEILF